MFSRILSWSIEVLHFADAFDPSIWLQGQPMSEKNSGPWVSNLEESDGLGGVSLFVFLVKCVLVNAHPEKFEMSPIQW